MASAQSSLTPSDRTDCQPMSNSPLHRAAFTGDVRGVEQLLREGVNVDALCGEVRENGKLSSITSLSLAAGQGHTKVVEILLKAGANLSILGHAEGGSALYVAAVYGNAEVATMLIKAGALVDLTDHLNRTPLFGAAFAGNDEVIEALISAHATVDIANCDGVTPLMTAARYGHERCVRLLLQAGADFSKAEHVTGFTALHCGAMGGSAAVLETLLSWGASMDALDARGLTALFAAVAGEQSTSAVKFLLDAGADPHVRDPDNATALMFTVDLPTVKLLLEVGVSATPVDDKGNTALHAMGAGGGSSGVICSIFKAGANPTLLNKAGLTAAQVAREKGHNDAATLLDMLATKYAQTENSVAEAKDTPSTIALSEGVAEMKAACAVDSTNDEVKGSQVVEEEQKHKVLRPCLNCQTLTHRRCARCRSVYICSHDCQVATLAGHKTECLNIYEEREKAKAERAAAKRQEESG